jgi:hypothetical protein
MRLVEETSHKLFGSHQINFSYCQHGIRNEISRVRTAMTRHKQLIERNTIRPVIDVGAAGRFIRHGLWDPNKPKDKDLLAPKSKKRKIDED